MLGLCAGWELDVETNQLPTFAWDDEEVPGGAVDGAFAPDVRERSERVDVHDAPDGVGGVANHLVVERLPNSGVRAVTALGGIR